MEAAGRGRGRGSVMPAWMKDNAPLSNGDRGPPIGDQKPDRYGHSLAVAEGKVPPPPKPERFADAEPTKKKGDPGENGSARDTRQRDGKGDEKAEGEVGESVKKDAASWEPPTWCKLPGHTSIRLEVQKEKDKVKVVKIHEQKTYVIGRNKETVDIVDLDQSTSRRHAAVLHGSRDSFLQDLGSAQGTFLNGKRLKAHQPKLLSEAATFKLGTSSILYTVRGLPLSKWKPPAWAGVPRPGMWFEWFKSDGTRGKIDLSSQSTYVFGRNPEVADLPENHPSVSRQHAALVHAPDGLYVIDLKSLHGTFINDSKVDESTNYTRPIMEGMSFRLGESDTKYVLGRTLHDFSVTGQAVPSTAKLADGRDGDSKGVWMTTETVVKKVGTTQAQAVRPKTSTTEMRKIINDTFARKKAEKMSLPAPFLEHPEADIPQPEREQKEKKAAEHKKSKEKKAAEKKAAAKRAATAVDAAVIGLSEDGPEFDLRKDVKRRR